MKARHFMRAVVVGGCGAMGSEATRDLATTGNFDEITIADLNLANAQALADELNASTGRGHVRAIQEDASDEDALVAIMRGQDVVVNTMSFHFGLTTTSCPRMIATNASSSEASTCMARTWPRPVLAFSSSASAWALARLRSAMVISSKLPVVAKSRVASDPIAPQPPTTTALMKCLAFISLVLEHIA